MSPASPQPSSARLDPSIPLGMNFTVLLPPVALHVQKTAFSLKEHTLSPKQEKWEEQGDPLEKLIKKQSCLYNVSMGSVIN